MEIRMIYSNHPECPFSGFGLVIAWPQEHFVRVMHPITLKEWTMPVRDHLNQQGVVDRDGYINSTNDTDLLWPVNQSKTKFSPEKMVNILRHSFQRECLYQGTISGETWVSVKNALINLTGLSEEVVEADLKELEKSTHSMPRPHGKKPRQVQMEGVMPAKKKASNHRSGLYVATPKLDPEKFKGQRNLVAKALGAFSTPKDLQTIVEKAEKNGGYKVAADGGITDSVHYHLRELVKMNLVKETKIEEPAAPKAEKAPKKAKKAAEEVSEAPIEEAVEVGVEG